MGLFKRDRKATERVQDLKNRVESLRKVDDQHRALTLDDFLAGDDAVTARGEPRYTPVGTPSAQQMNEEGDLAAELQRYLQNHVEPAEFDDLESVVAAPGFEQPVSRSEAPVARPVSIEEFPPLPAKETVIEPRVNSFEAPSPPRLNAEDEAALLAELQRYLKTDGIEGNDDALGDRVPPMAVEPLVADTFAWPETAPASAPVEEVFEMPVATDVFAEPTSPEAGAETEPATVVEIDGRTYEVPKPRHWPSVPAPTPASEKMEQHADDRPVNPEPDRPRKRASDWEPL